MTQTCWRIQNTRETWYFQDAYLDAHGEILSHGVFVQNGSLEIVWDKTLLLPILCDYKYNGSSVLKLFSWESVVLSVLNMICRLPIEDPDIYIVYITLSTLF